MILHVPHLALALAVAGPVSDGLEDAPPRFADGEIALDGRLDDWPADLRILATPQYLYLRLDAGSEFTLQGGQRSTAIWLDVDGRVDTGRETGSGDDTLGVDLEILFSPPSPERGKGPRSGIELRAYDDLGLFQKVGHADVDFAFAPTFAARSYEIRIARRSSLREPVGSRWHASKRVRAGFELIDERGAVTRSELLVADLPPAEPRTPAKASLPTKQAGETRVLSWNVEWEQPEQNPKPFSRILRALAPDVILIQEWKATTATLEAWFSAHVPSTTPWRAHTFSDLGVAVVSRHSLTPLQKERLVPEVSGREPRAVRFVAARVEAPSGPLIAGSLHLKCCGAKGTKEDTRRRLEAEAIQGFLRDRLVATPEVPCVVAGDFNLVGTDQPLTALRTGLDGDGSDLDVIEAYVLGDASSYTWYKDSSRFSPGRLDFAVWSDSVLDARRAFVLDSARLSDAARGEAGLTAGDSAASDHRPLVFDLAPAAGGDDD